MGPRTQQHLVDALDNGTFTDVFLFSHGWNNDWTTALGRYRDFMTTFRKMINSKGFEFDRDYRPLLAGVFWPSATLVMPWERGPQFAGDEGTTAAEEIDLSLITDLAARVDRDQLTDFYRLVERQSLDKTEATELLELLSATFAAGDPDLDADDHRDVRDVLAAWTQTEAAVSPRRQPQPRSPGDFGTAAPAPAPTEPEAAGFLDKLNPRNLVRLLTVYQMKDRAGVVGAAGIGPLLRGMLDATTASTRFHLIGHSYGARVLLNAVARPVGPVLPRPVTSMLLLQPAINHLCFSTLPDGRVGGYRPALGLVDRPILTTFSSHDFPLRNTFHIALQRAKDLGEVEIAADEPPNRYAALGGWGPRGDVGFHEVGIKDPGEPYELTDGAPEVWAVNGSRTIGGHGDVVNDSTAWALFQLARA
ncbi:hypothetical protein LRS71_24575 [Rhodococcus pyridinivorans]|uniref:hypothetical protein n=1 Tax=Rhodococcus pyridinivorans TaxID=103816 RepID=UPI001E47E467|nr:hypothetical protein [Rhodococcus pyridinivorans]MCD5422689.1 hypothetical protein [Rhodococcus pyridinivorans]